MKSHTFHNYKYAIWNTDLTYLKCIIDVELEKAFTEADTYAAPEKIGDGLSLMPKVMKNMQCFEQMYSWIENEIAPHFTNLDIPVYYRRKKLNLKRCWANRIYKNTKGTIHHHAKSLVLIVYYNAPHDSSNIVFIDPKHKDKLYKEESIIPESEKMSIKVTTGMMLLHDGRILHAVTEHQSDVPRDVLVFEFDSIFM